VCPDRLIAVVDVVQRPRNLTQQITRIGSKLGAGGLEHRAVLLVDELYAQTL
jgi:hypothetical protein